MLEWYDDAIAGRWEEAVQRQRRVHDFSHAKQILAGSGNLHGIVNKAMGAASPFLVGENRTRRPYLAVPESIVTEFRAIVEEQFQDLIWKP